MPTEPESVEQDDVGCEAIPADLVELHEVLEWEAAVHVRDDDPLPGDEAPGASGVLGHDPEDL
jgi:hypothetical protein